MEFLMSDDLSREIQGVISRILHERKLGASICPSEVARQMFASPEWRERMSKVREVAQKMACEGRLEICQKGEAVNPDDFRGPIRLRLPNKSKKPERS